MKKSKEEAKGWRDEHSKCGGVGGRGVYEVGKMQRGRERSRFLFLQLSWQTYLMAGRRFTQIITGS